MLFKVRFGALLLLTFLVSSSLNVFASNVSDFKFDASTGTITKYISSSTKVVVPEVIKGIHVKAIGDKAFAESHIVSVVLPKSVEEIGEYSFGRCYALTRVELPSNLKTIKTGAFSGDYSLKIIKLPEGLKTISSSAFYNCSNINVNIPSTVTYIGSSAFYQCSSMKKVIIPDSIDTIYNNTFYGIVDLKKLKLPANLKTIQSGAFKHVRNIRNVVIPEGTQSIGSFAFDSLESISIPDSVTYIAKDAFYRSAKMTIITTMNSYANWYARDNNYEVSFFYRNFNGECAM